MSAEDETRDFEDEPPGYGTGYRDGENSLTADIRHQFTDAASSMDDLLRFFRTITGDQELNWPPSAEPEEDNQP